MERELAQRLRNLLETQRIGSLGTLHEGEPYVSMVPFALVPLGTDLIIHVSELAGHTQDMIDNPKVSLMVSAPSSHDVPPQALARVTIQGHATQIAPGTPAHAEAKQAYLTRYPRSSTTFELADFSLFAIRPRSVRFVGGFADAKNVTPEELAEVLRKAG